MYSWAVGFANRNLYPKRGGVAVAECRIHGPWLSFCSPCQSSVGLTKQLKSPPSRKFGNFCSNGGMAASTLRLHVSPAGVYMDAIKRVCSRETEEGCNY